MDASVEYRLETDRTLTEFTKSNPDATIFVRGHAGGRIMMAATRTYCHIRIENEAEGPHLLDVFEKAREQGLLMQRTNTLVDMRGFIGSIDWEAVSKIGAAIATTPAPAPRIQAKVAYLLNNKASELLLKVLAVLFPQVVHKSFDTEADARLWLGWH